MSVVMKYAHPVMPPELTILFFGRKINLFQLDELSAGLQSVKVT